MSLECIKRILSGVSKAPKKEVVEETGTIERPSSRDIIPYSAIKVKGTKVTVDFGVAVEIAEIADTNSMDPVFDIGHNAILLRDFDRSELTEGDVVVYRLYGGNIIHRIIHIQEDEGGRNYQLKGDNNPEPDPYWIKDEHIKYLMVGVVY